MTAPISARESELRKSLQIVMEQPYARTHGLTLASISQALSSYPAEEIRLALKVMCKKKGPEYFLRETHGVYISDVEQLKGERLCVKIHTPSGSRHRTLSASRVRKGGRVYFLLTLEGSWEIVQVAKTVISPERTLDAMQPPIEAAVVLDVDLDQFRGESA